MVMTEHLAHVSHGQLSYGLVLERGRVTDAPPAGRWAVGLDWSGAAAGIRDRRGTVRWEPERIRLIITGSREWPDSQAVWDFLARAYAAVYPTGLTIVHGACGRGADKAASEYAQWAERMPGMDVLEERWPAKWDELGRSAGMARNKAMVAAGADGCAAFILDASPGATGCAAAAKAAGIPVVRDERWTSPWPGMWAAAMEAESRSTGPLTEARYAGRCRGCAGRWEPGDLIAFDEDEAGWICEDCAVS